MKRGFQAAARAEKASLPFYSASPKRDAHEKLRVSEIPIDKGPELHYSMGVQLFSVDLNRRVWSQISCDIPYQEKDLSSVLPNNESLAEGIYALLERRLASGYYLPGQKLPSVRELAEEYQMSVGTVSGVLQRLRDKGIVELRRGRGAFACDIQSRQRDCLKLGLLYFSRSGQALSLEAGPFGYSVFEGIRRFCVDNGHKLAVRPVFSDPAKVKSVIEDIREQGDIHGVVLLYADNQEFSEYVHWFAEASIPLVLIDNPWREKHEYSFVAADDLQIGIHGADYLYHLGHRNILCLMPDYARCLEDHFLGFKTALMRHDIDLPDSNIFRFNAEPEADRAIEEAVSRIVSDRSENRITAVYCGGDKYALELIERLRDQGIKVPDDISVMGATGSNLGLHYHPALTTVTSGLEAMGAQACEILCKLIEDPQSGPYQEIRDAHVVERESTRAL